MSAPSITVLMPVYNAEKYLREAIDSILNQTFKDFEFLIINDGSTDSSQEIILSYTDTRIRYIKNETNLRLIATLNKGLDLCIGKYVARMDADDISEPDRLQQQFDFMEQHPEVAMCGSWFELFGDRHGVVKYVADHNQIMMKMLYQCHFCHPSVILRKQAVDSFEKKFDAQFLHAEDYEFFVRVAEKFKVSNLQKALLKYRQHTSSVSLQNSSTQQANSVVIKKQMFKKMGLDVTEAELQLYQSIAQYEYTPTEDYLNRAQVLLEKMQHANDKSGYIDKEFFKKQLSVFWFNVTYNATRLGIAAYNKYSSSFLSQAKVTTPLQKIKLLVKAIIKV